jgi:hypothetical protein
VSKAPVAFDLKARSVARGWPELERRALHGRAQGQVVWQPRIQAWRDDKLYFGEPLPEPYDRLSEPDIFRYLDCSSRVYQFNACFVRVEHPRVEITTRTLGGYRTLRTIRTPLGEQTAITEQRPTCRAAIYAKREIETLEDLRLATWRAENAHYVFDRERYDQLLAEWGDLGLPTMYLPRVNIQDLYINTMGTQAAIYALQDWGAEAFRPYFRALDDLHDQLIDVINSVPEIEIVNFGDNLHASTLTPRWYEQYVLPSYLRRCARLHRAGKFVHSHWDGNVGPLLRYARDSGLDGIEAITPLPQGDVSLEQVREALGDRVWLIDGLPAVYFDPTYPPEVLEACTEEILRLFAPRLLLGISDEISSHGDIERVRQVGRIVDAYNAQQRRK